MEFLEGRIFEDVRMPDVGSDEDRKEWYVVVTAVDCGEGTDGFCFGR